MEMSATSPSSYGIPLPSGKLTYYGKSPSLMGKSTINGPFSIATLVYQRVLHDFSSHKKAFFVYVTVNILYMDGGGP